MLKEGWKSVSSCFSSQRDPNAVKEVCDRSVRDEKDRVGKFPKAYPSSSFVGNKQF